MNPKSERYNFTVHSFGCKVNTYDTGLLQQRLEKAGFRYEPNKPSVHILNSCAVTAEATKEAMRLARRLKASDPLATVVMTGCAAQVDGKVLDQAPGIDLVVANSHKGQLESLLDQYFRGDLEERVFRSNIFRKEDLEAGGGVEAAHTRAFLKIQDGCNSFCTFCVIPYARGKSRSIAIQDLVRRIRDLHKSGLSEVVLTGVHIGDYQDPSREGESGDLAALVAAVLLETEIPRLRLSSLEPIELNDRLFALFENPRLCRHFHISLQAASTRVLSAMKRRYSREDVVSALERIHSRVPGSFVGIDVIAGFPTESEEEFAETYQTLNETPWTRLHVFPYSERPGTRAALLAGVPQAVRAARAARLRSLSSERFTKTALEQNGEIKKVLLLKSQADDLRGLTRDYWPIKMDRTSKEELAIGQEIEVRVTGFEQAAHGRMDGGLIGAPLS